MFTTDCSVRSETTCGLAALHSSSTGRCLASYHMTFGNEVGALYCIQNVQLMCRFFAGKIYTYVK